MTTDKKDKKDTLATKLAKIGAEIGAVSKSGKNFEQKYNYIEYSVVAGKIRELFNKYNVSIVPNVDDVIVDNITSKYGSAGYHYLLKMTFTIINGDDLADKQVAHWVGESSDYGDKGINKAETAGVKYFLMRLFNVSEKGDEDADGATPEPATESKRQSADNKRRFTTADISKAKIELGLCLTLDELKTKYAKLGALALDPEVVAYKDELKTKFAEKEH